MIKPIFCIYDNVAQVYNAPFCAINEAFACRDFENSIKRADTLLATNPSDFNLMKLGSFDDATGLITQDSNPTVLLSGKDIKEKNDVEFSNLVNERVKEGR